MLRRMKLFRFLVLTLLATLICLFLVNRLYSQATPSTLQRPDSLKEVDDLEIVQKRRDELYRERQEQARGEPQAPGPNPQFKRPKDLNHPIGVPGRIGEGGGTHGRGINEYPRKEQDKERQRMLSNWSTGRRMDEVNNKNFKTEGRGGGGGRSEQVHQFTERMRMEMYRLQKDYEMRHSNDSKIFLGETFDPDSYLNHQRYHGDPKHVMSRFQFNQLASDNTPYNRSLWDIRIHQCKRKHDSSVVNDLPTTSVVICFHNEARSALLRTIYSVLSHGPAKLINDLVLVDDFSDDINDGKLLEVIPKVKVIRLNERQGLIRARLIGAQASQGDVLTFLDSHCEVTPGWLEPLLARIKEDKHHVVSPVIDIIRKEDMKYNQANSNIKGGFGHNLLFKWENLNWQELQRRRHDNTAPIPTPAIAGGLFSIDRKYFEEIGSYDEEMEIWGGENVEFSIRVWLCGGRLEITPCSHVGHIFRSTMPYTFGKGRSYHSTVTRNLRRTAEVWMDEYKHLFYTANAGAVSVPYGNVSSRLQLKKRLSCKPFSWFIEKIYPEFIPSLKGDTSKTTVRIKQGPDCLQCQDYTAGMYRLMVKTCDVTDNKNMWTFTNKGHLKYQTLCLTAAKSKIDFLRHSFGTPPPPPPPAVSLSFCLTSTETSQVFESERIDGRRVRGWGDRSRDSFVKIKHKSSRFCLSRHAETRLAVLETCDPRRDEYQIWSLAL